MTLPLIARVKILGRCRGIRRTTGFRINRIQSSVLGILATYDLDLIPSRVLDIVDSR